MGAKGSTNEGWRFEGNYCRNETGGKCVVCGGWMMAHGYHLHPGCQRWFMDNVVPNTPLGGGYAIGSPETCYGPKACMIDDEEGAEVQLVAWGMAHDILPSANLDY